MARPDEFYRRLQQAIADNPTIPEKGQGRVVIQEFFEQKRALSLAQLRQRINQ